MRKYIISRQPLIEGQQFKVGEIMPFIINTREQLSNARHLALSFRGIQDVYIYSAIQDEFIILIKKQIKISFKRGKKNESKN